MIFASHMTKWRDDTHAEIQIGYVIGECYVP